MKQNESTQEPFAPRDLHRLMKFADQRELLQTAIDALPEQFFVKDTEGRFVFVNQKTASRYGLTTEEIVGKTDFDFYPSDEAEGFRQEEIGVMQSGEPFLSEPLIGYHDRALSWHQVGKYRLMDAEGNVTGICGMSRRVTDFKQSELLLLAQSEVLEMVAAHRPLVKIFERICSLIDGQMSRVESAIAILADDHRTFDYVISQAVPEALGDKLVGVDINEKVGSCPLACATREVVIAEDIETDPYWETLRDLFRPYGYRASWSTPVVLSDGTVTGAFSLYSKSPGSPSSLERELAHMAVKLAAAAIETHAAHEAIRYAAEHDHLTGLCNRNAFLERLELRIQEAKESGRQVIVGYIDLDDFKLINDRHGHRAGDDLLKEIASRLTARAGKGDIVARFGGDEFVFLLDLGDGKLSTDIKVENALADLDHAFVADNHRLQIAFSTGVATFPEDGETAGQLLTRADTAMNYAKRLQARYMRYNSRMDHERREKQAGIASLSAGIDAGEIDVDLQPQFSFAKQELVGFEALARWQHPQLGRLGAASFIQLAEDGGLISALGESVLRKTCQLAVNRIKTTGESVRMAVNVSASQFADGVILNQVNRALDESGLDPRQLELELTERVLMGDLSSAKDIMSELKGMGVQMALDDFGSGYANLSVLSALPLDCLKIDRSIVQEVTRNSAAADIASAIIAMTHRLRMKVLAEGVETPEQLAFFAENDCDLVQGYLLGRPMDYESALTAGAVDWPL